jgi:hypothetical protein
MRERMRESCDHAIFGRKSDKGDVITRVRHIPKIHQHAKTTKWSSSTQCCLKLSHFYFINFDKKGSYIKYTADLNCYTEASFDKF